MPLPQISIGDGGVPGTALHTVVLRSSEHTFTPVRAQAPRPAVHGAPTSKPSSIWPSQLLSMPSPHSSTGAGLPGLAAHSVPSPLAVHTFLPLREQAPMPTVHGAPTSKPSSVWP